MKENMGIQPNNIPEKIGNKRKTQWNGIIANNKLTVIFPYSKGEDTLWNFSFKVFHEILI